MIPRTNNISAIAATSNRTARQPPPLHERSTPTSPFNQPFTPLKSTFRLRTRHASSRQVRRRSGVTVPRAEARRPVGRAEARRPDIPSKISEMQPRPSNSASSSTNTTEFTEPPSPPRITSSRQLRADARAAVLPSAADDQKKFGAGSSPSPPARSTQNLRHNGLRS